MTVTVNKWYTKMAKQLYNYIQQLTTTVTTYLKGTKTTRCLLLTLLLFVVTTSYGIDIQKLLQSVVVLQDKATSGTGFFVSSNGYILTNSHVVYSVVKSTIVVRGNMGVYIFPGLTVVDFVVVKNDPVMDLALLRLSSFTITSQYLQLSHKPTYMGDNVYIMSSPFTLGWLLTTSLVSGYIAERQSGLNYMVLQHGAWPGSSGGPVVNNHGEVVGVIRANIGSRGIGGLVVVTPVKTVKAFLRGTPAEVPGE